jgi:CheY-like chemotaxis protein
MKEPFLLLVDDNEGDILLTKEGFSERGIVEKIVIARNGEEAVSFLQVALRESQLPNLILLDVNMPRMNGYEVLKYIKDNRELKHIPVLMLTTSSSSKEIRNAYENFANGFITKPQNIHDFLMVVQKIEDFWFKTASLP